MALCPAEKKRRQNKHRRIILEGSTTEPVIVVLTDAADGLVYYTEDDGTTWNTSDYYTSAGLTGGQLTENDIRQHPVTGCWYIARGASQATSERIIKSSSADLSTCTWSDVTNSLNMDFGDGVFLHDHMSLVQDAVNNTLFGVGSTTSVNEMAFYVDSAGSLPAASDFTGNLNNQPFVFYNSGIPNIPAIRTTDGMCLLSGYRQAGKSINSIWTSNGGTTFVTDNDLSLMLGTSGATWDPFTDRFILLDDGGGELSWVEGANGGESANGNWNNVAIDLSTGGTQAPAFCYNPYKSDGELFCVGLAGDVYTSNDTTYANWTKQWDTGTEGQAAYTMVTWDPYNERLVSVGTAGGEGYLYGCGSNNLDSWSQLGVKVSADGFERVYVGDMALGA